FPRAAGAPRDSSPLGYYNSRRRWRGDRTRFWASHDPVRGRPEKALPRGARAPIIRRDMSQTTEAEVVKPAAPVAVEVVGGVEPDANKRSAQAQALAVEA